MIPMSVPELHSHETVRTECCRMSDSIAHPRPSRAGRKPSGRAIPRGEPGGDCERGLRGRLAGVAVQRLSAVAAGDRRGPGLVRAAADSRAARGTHRARHRLDGSGALGRVRVARLGVVAVLVHPRGAAGLRAGRLRRPPARPRRGAAAAGLRLGGPQDLPQRLHDGPGAAADELEAVRDLPGPAGLPVLPRAAETHGDRPGHADRRPAGRLLDPPDARWRRAQGRSLRRVSPTRSKPTTCGSGAGCQPAAIPGRLATCPTCRPSRVESPRLSAIAPGGYTEGLCQNTLSVTVRCGSWACVRRRARRNTAARRRSSCRPTAAWRRARCSARPTTRPSPP